MKKLLMLVLPIMIIFGLGACGKEETQIEADFTNASVNLSGAVSLGISMKNNDTELNNSSSYNIFNNTQGVSADEVEEQLVLTMIDEDGVYKEVVYLDEDGNEVEIPYYLTSLEIVGDFIFLSYVEERYFHEMCSDDINLCGIDQGGEKARFGSNDKFEWLDFVLENIDDENGFDVKYIVIEKNSGKVFDLGDIYFDILDTDNNGYSDYGLRVLLYVYEDLIYINDTDISGPLTIIDYNEETMNMDVETFLPSAIGIEYLFRTPLGTTILKMNDEYSYLKSDNLTFGQVDEYFEDFNSKALEVLQAENLDYSFNMEDFSIENIAGFIPYEDKIVYLLNTTYGGFVLITNHSDEIINIFKVPDSLGVNFDDYQNPIKLTEDLIIKNNLLIDISESTVELLDIQNEYTYFKSENSIAIYSYTDLLKIDYLTKEVVVIDENITFEDPEDEEYGILYLYYSVNVGVSKQYKKYILSTGEVITGDYVPPIVEVFSVRPLN